MVNIGCPASSDTMGMVMAWFSIGSLFRHDSCGNTALIEPPPPSLPRLLPVGRPSEEMERPRGLPSSASSSLPWNAPLVPKPYLPGRRSCGWMGCETLLSY